jgi:DNA-binding NarL/FixJ family response regulator
MTGLSNKPNPPRLTSEMQALIIDNDATAALGVRVALERLGVNVIAEVSRIEDASSYSADLICCDLVLSRQGLALRGAAGVAPLTSEGHRVLALSSIARSHEVGNVIGAGALGFIERDDLDWADFAVAVGDVGNGRHHLSRTLAARLIADLHERPLPPDLELDHGARELFDALFAKGETFLSTIPLQERVALGSKVWLVWSRGAARYRMELTPRHIEILRRFHNGETTDVIARALNVGVRSIQSDQDRIKAMLYAAYGKDLRREAACRLVWQLIDGQVSWGSSTIRQRSTNQ